MIGEAIQYPPLASMCIHMHLHIQTHTYTYTHKEFHILEGERNYHWIIVNFVNFPKYTHILINVSPRSRSVTKTHQSILKLILK